MLPEDQCFICFALNTRDKSFYLIIDEGEKLSLRELNMSFGVLLRDENLKKEKKFEFEKPKYQIEDAVYIH